MDRGEAKRLDERGNQRSSEAIRCHLGLDRGEAKRLDERCNQRSSEAIRGHLGLDRGEAKRLDERANDFFALEGTRTVLVEEVVPDGNQRSLEVIRGH